MVSSSSKPSTITSPSSHRTIKSTLRLSSSVTTTLIVPAVPTSSSSVLWRGRLLVGCWTSPPALGGEGSTVGPGLLRSAVHQSRELVQVKPRFLKGTEGELGLIDGLGLGSLRQAEGSWPDSLLHPPRRQPSALALNSVATIE